MYIIRRRKTKYIYLLLGLLYPLLYFVPPSANIIYPYFKRNELALMKLDSSYKASSICSFSQFCNFHEKCPITAWPLMACFVAAS